MSLCLRHRHRRRLRRRHSTLSRTFILALAATLHDAQTEQFLTSLLFCHCSTAPLFPFQVTFRRQPEEGKRLAYEQRRERLEAERSHRGDAATDSALAALEAMFTESSCRLKLMIKNGDDVRQDQLILQLIRVMDHCLKRVGLDLKLTVSS